MRIIIFYICYNEMKLLPYQYEYCKQNNVEMFVIDNMSTDGTREFLRSKKIPHSFIATNESFDLLALISELTTQIHEQKPDWFIYSAGDMFYETADGLRNTIEKCDAEGYNKIEMKLRQFPNIGEDNKPGNPFCNYLFTSKTTEYDAAELYNKRTLISKYSESVRIAPDAIIIDDPYIKGDAGIIFEMHACKTTEERMQTFQRRQKAWDNGLNPEFGWHYREGAKHNFIFDKNKCISIEELPEEFLLYKRLQQIKI